MRLSDLQPGRLLVALCAALAVAGPLSAQPVSAWIDPITRAVTGQAALKGRHDPATITVRFRSSASKAAVDTAISRLGGRTKWRSRYAAGPRVITVPAGSTVLETLALYRGRADVLYAEPSYLDQPCFTPNDPEYTRQWHFTMIGMPAAWDRVPSRGSASVKVAIVDTGIAFENHDTYTQAPDLAGVTFVSPYDAVDYDTHPVDDNGHGTHVCGTIAQATDNGVGVAGMADHVSIMPVRSLGPGGGYHSQFWDAVHWAVDQGAKVINYSGGGSDSDTKHEAAAYAYHNGVLLVAAMGNDNQLDPEKGFPGRYPEAMGVSAVGATKARASYSNYGADLDIAAPGGDGGYSVVQNTFSGTPTNFGYLGYQGTSMATPHVAGLAALLITQGRYTTRQAVFDRIKNTAEDLGAAGWDNQFGWGLINANAALNGEPGTPSGLTVAPATPYCTSTLQASASANDPDSDALTYTYEWSKSTDGGTNWTAWGYSSTDGTLSGVSLVKGNLWRVQAKATDGVATSGWTAPVQVTIANSTPATPDSLAITPATAYANSNLQASASSTDPDADPVTITYQWSQYAPDTSSNKSPGGTWGDWAHDSTNGQLTGVALKKGDLWRVRALASDGAADSAWCAPVEITVQNAPPSLPGTPVLSPDPAYRHSSVQASASSSDVDGDTLTYTHEWSHSTDGGANWSEWGNASSDGQLTGVTLTKGEVWRVRVKASDGSAESGWSTPAELAISNSLPTRPSTLTVSPQSPVCTSTLDASGSGSTDADGDTLTWQYQWSKLEGAAGTSGQTKATWSAWGHDSEDGSLTNVTLAKGEVWRAQARAHDGTAAGPWSDPVEVTIGNTPPNAPSVVISPAKPKTLAELSANVFAPPDADGEVPTYETKWRRYTVGAGWSEWDWDGTTVAASETTRGEQWQAHSRTWDGTNYSDWVESATVTILNTLPQPPATVVIAPAYPRTTADLRPVITAGSDADGDSLTYRYEWSRSTDAGKTWSAWTWKVKYLGHGETARDEKWRVRCRSHDGLAGGSWRVSEPVKIANSAPSKPTKVTITPPSPAAPNADLTAAASGTQDRDPGDAVSYLYEWRRSRDGGQTWSAWGWPGAVLSNKLTSPRDRWQVRACASDGTRQTAWTEGGVVTISTATGGVPLLTAAAGQTRGRTVAVSVSLSQAASVNLEVCNLAGHVVGLVPGRMLPAGRSTLLWSGAGVTGSPLPAGTYLLRVTARTGVGAQTQSLLTLRMQR